MRFGWLGSQAGIRSVIRVGHLKVVSQCRDPNIDYTFRGFLRRPGDWANYSITKDANGKTELFPKFCDGLYSRLVDGCHQDSHRVCLEIPNFQAHSKASNDSNASVCQVPLGTPDQPTVREAQCKDCGSGARWNFVPSSSDLSSKVATKPFTP